MKKTVFVKMVALVCLGILFAGYSRAQQDDKSKRPSPPAMAKGTIKGSMIMIDYSSPSVKGRNVFGDLEPFGKVWRAGANEATIFTTSKDIEVEGKKLAAGKYSLFMTPGEKEWTVYFNSETGQWGDNDKGEANMNPAKTVLQVKVKPKDVKDVQEKLVYNIIDKDFEKGFDMIWNKTRVFVSVK